MKKPKFWENQDLEFGHILQVDISALLLVKKLTNFIIVFHFLFLLFPF